MTEQGAQPYEDLGAWLTDDLFPGWARYWNDTDAVPPTFETPKPPWFRNTRVLAGVIAAVPGILEVNVYGVEIPGCSGRAGMASLVVDEAQFDPARVREAVHAGLPGYARPLFLRLTRAMEVTGTFKQKKSEAIQEGFDPRTVADTLMFDDPRHEAYVPLSPALHAEIVSGALRL